MSNYTLPAATFQQEFKALSPTVQQDQTVCVIGPKRKIVKSGIASAADLTYGAYDPADGNAFAFLGLPAGETVDSGSVQVSLVGALAKYGTVSGANIVEVGASMNRITIGHGAGSADAFAESENAVRLSGLGARDVRVGDRVKITHQSGVLTTKVTALESRLSDAEFSEIETAAIFNDSQNPSNQPVGMTTAVVSSGVSGRVIGDITQDTAGLRYIGDLARGIIDEVYTLTVTTAGGFGVAVLSYVSSEADVAGELTVPADGSTRVAIGTRGLGLKFPNTDTRPFVVGEIFTVTAQSAYTRIAAEYVDETYTGTADTTYVIRVIKGGLFAANPKVSISSSNGVDVPSTQTVSAADGELILGGKGPTIALVDGSEAQGGLRLGDAYVVTVTAPVANGKRTIKISDPIPDVDEDGDEINAEGYDLSVDFLVHDPLVSIPSSGYPEFADENWTTTGTTITLEPGISIFNASVVDELGDLVSIPVESATVRVEYTAIIRIGSTAMQTISAPTSVEGILGAIVPENEAAFGVYCALLNSGGGHVAVITTPGDDLTAYNAAIRVAERSDDIYFITPMTHDADVIAAVQAHVINMSSEEVGMERMAIVNLSLNRTLDLFVLLPDGEPGETWSGIIADDGSGAIVNLRMIGATFISAEVRAGDLVRTNFTTNIDGTESFETYTVLSVSDEENLVLVSGPALAVGTLEIPRRIEIFRNHTTGEIASAAEAAASALGDRRVVNIFPDRLMASSGLTVDGFFAGAAVAALKGSVVAHQPITNVDLIGFEGGSLLQEFSREELNIVAGGGNLVIAQDTPWGSVYVRHQLTTDNTDANHSEISITTNVDLITRFLRAVIKPMIGQYNITPEFLLQLVTLAQQQLDMMVQETLRLKAGPAIISNGRITAVQNPATRTGIIMEIPLSLPYPANNIVTRLVVN